MNGVHINKLDVLGEKIDLYVDNSGTFRAEYQGEEYHAATAVEVKTMLTKAIRADKETRAVSVSIIDLVPNTKKKRDSWGDRPEPFVEGRGVVHGKLRGRHGHHHEWLLEADGKKFTLRCSGSNNIICLRLSPTRVKEYLQLAAEFDKAEAAFEAWKKENTVDVAEIARLCRL